MGLRIQNQWTNSFRLFKAKGMHFRYEFSQLLYITDLIEFNISYLFLSLIISNALYWLGGYDTLELKFYPRIASHETSLTGECLPVLVYIANEMNENWLGEDELENIANQIVECRGQSGHNVEYVIRLARFMHEELPDANDEHLFNLENLVLQALQLRQIPLISVMGKDPVRIQRDSYETTKRTSSFDFTSRLPERKLRCLNI